MRYVYLAASVAYYALGTITNCPTFMNYIALLMFVWFLLSFENIRQYVSRLCAKIQNKYLL